MATHDIVIIGGGIVGLSTARALVAAQPGLDVAVVEKEPDLATHQSGRNSGVIHAGVYYAPGSLKARFGTEGNRMMKAFCTEHGITFNECGKVVVATNEAQIPALDELARRSEANGVNFSRIGAEGLAEREPHVAGVDALWVNDTGVVDFREVALKYAELATAGGATIRTGFAVTSAHNTDRNTMRLESPAGWVEAPLIVNCTGVYVDRMAKLLGHTPKLQIVPFRGEYREVTGYSAELVKGLVYPVPDPELPFLGVHFTRGIHNRVEVGPNAVLAFDREAYVRTKFSATDLGETLKFGGFRKLAKTYWKTGAAEMWRSVNKRDFIKNARSLLPALRAEDLGDFRAGIRAQALDPSGELIKDFVVEETERAVHVLNAPSPAATASLMIGDHIAGIVQNKL